MSNHDNYSFNEKIMANKRFVKIWWGRIEKCVPPPQEQSILCFDRFSAPDTLATSSSHINFKWNGIGHADRIISYINQAGVMGAQPGKPSNMLCHLSTKWSFAAPM